MPGSDLHASADYRSELVQALTTRALQQASTGPAPIPPAIVS